MYVIRVGCGIGGVIACLGLLVGCASSRPSVRASAVNVRDARAGYRFEMSRGGRQMSADQFDAWMKANGIRIAKGAVANGTAGKTETASAQAEADVGR